MPATNSPDRVRGALTKCPTTGNGVHRWLFCTALKLHRAQLKRQEMALVLEMQSANCGRRVLRREIEDAISASERLLLQASGQSGAKPGIPKWPGLNQEKIEAICHSGPGLEQLKETSPIKWNDDKSHAEEIIDALFQGNPLLCVAQSKYKFDTRPRESWRGSLSTRELIVPSPMTALQGITKSGKRSPHTIDNTGPRRFLVIEFDSGTFDQHAAILLHLAEFGPLVMAVHSGGKSLHGWFYCQGQNDARLLRFMRYAVSLGADPATWLRSQFVRLPDGRRENGNRQEVMFFNSRNLEGK